jgi:hypothetical protein
MMRIAARYCGPPDSANGGYCAGALAAHLQSTLRQRGPVEVTLRRPPPLERDLLPAVEGARVRLMNGAELVAEARPAELEAEPPSPPSFERAEELSGHYIGHLKHHFPTCFVCGPARRPGDGLRIFPGAERAEQPVAAPWVPDVSLASSSGQLPAPLIWAALDCAGYFAVGAPEYPVALLGRMTAQVTRDVHVGERCVVIGWAIGREGRKLHAGTAVFGEQGEICARARQTWIVLPTGL